MRPSEKQRLHGHVGYDWPDWVAAVHRVLFEAGRPLTMAQLSFKLKTASASERRNGSIHWHGPTAWRWTYGAVLELREQWAVVKLPNEQATGSRTTYGVCVDRAEGLAMQLHATRLELPRAKGLRLRRLTHVLDGLVRLCEDDAESAHAARNSTIAAGMPF